MSDSLSSQRYSRRSFLNRAGVTAGAVAAASTGLGLRVPSAKAASTTLTIAVFGPQTAATAVQQKFAPIFAKTHPGVTLNFMGINGTDWNDFFSKLLTLIASGNAPDVATIATEGLQLFAAQGLAEPLDHLIMANKSSLKGYFSDVHPLLIEAMMYQGSVFVLPTDFNAGNLFYDQTLFAKHGIARPPAHWSITDFEAICRKLGKANSGFVAWDWVVRLWGSWTSWMYANNGNLLTEGRWPGGQWMWNEFYKHDPAAKGRKGGWHWGEPTANAPEVVEALQFMVDLKKEGYSSYPDIGGGTTLQGLFASNHIGMTPGGGFWAGGLHNAGMKTNQFDVQYFPAWATQKHLLGTGGYALLKQSKNKQLAFEFLLTLTSPGAIEAVVNGNVTTPARRSLMKASSYGPTGPKHWSVFYDTLDKFPNTTPIPAPPFYQGLANSLNVRTTQAMSSGKVQVALNAMQKDLEKLHKSSKHG